MPLHILVSHISCFGTTDGIGSDQIGLIVFRGNTDGDFDSNVRAQGPGHLWDDFDKGEERGRDVVVASYRANSVYVVILFEQDHATDLTDPLGLKTYKDATALTWRAEMARASVSGGSISEQEKAAAARAVGDTMKKVLWPNPGATIPFTKGDDDWIGQPTQLVIKPDVQPELTFIGGGGRYRVRFKVKDVEFA